MILHQCLITSNSKAQGSILHQPQQQSFVFISGKIPQLSLLVQPNVLWLQLSLPKEQGWQRTLLPQQYSQDPRLHGGKHLSFNPQHFCHSNKVTNGENLSNSHLKFYILGFIIWLNQYNGNFWAHNCHLQWLLPELNILLVSTRQNC